MLLSRSSMCRHPHVPLQGCLPNSSPGKRRWDEGPAAIRVFHEQLPARQEAQAPTLCRSTAGAWGHPSHVLATVGVAAAPAAGELCWRLPGRQTLLPRGRFPHRRAEGEGCFPQGDKQGDAARGDLAPESFSMDPAAGSDQLRDTGCHFGV